MKHPENFFRDWVSVLVRLADGTSLVLHGVDAQSFDGEAPVRIERVDALYAIVVSYGWHGVFDRASGHYVKTLTFGGALNLGSTGPGPRPAHTFRNVVDALSRPDELVDTWRALPRCPEFAETADLDGTEYRYCVGSDLVRDQPPLAEHWPRAPP